MPDIPAILPDIHGIIPDIHRILPDIHEILPDIPAILPDIHELLTETLTIKCLLKFIALSQLGKAALLVLSHNYILKDYEENFLTKYSENLCITCFIKSYFSVK